MPERAPSACKRSGCAGLVRDGVCYVCGPLRVARNADVDQRRGTAAQRGYGGRWQRVRAMYLRSHPLCAACEREGRVSIATDVHHLIPRRDGGPDTESNLEALCHACHSRITALGG
jgi:5-methylcytosine-specific restriction enzyme A